MKVRIVGIKGKAPSHIQYLIILANNTTKLVNKFHYMRQLKFIYSPYTLILLTGSVFMNTCNFEMLVPAVVSRMLVAAGVSQRNCTSESSELSEL